MTVRPKIPVAARVLSDAVTSATGRGRVLKNRQARELRSKLAEFSCIGVLVFAGGATVLWSAFILWGLGKLMHFW
jgi:hypothetical protein